MLLILYYMVTIINTNRITEQITHIRDHPYPASIAAGEVSTGATQLRYLPERLVYSHDPVVIETVRGHYQSIDENMVKNIDVIDETYLTNPNDAVLLRSAYTALYAAQEELLSLCSEPDTSDEEVEAFIEKNLTPNLDEIDRLIIAIINGTQSKLASFDQTAHQTRVTTIVFSSVLILSVFAALSIYLSILRHKREQEKRISDALRDALKSAENANAAKSQFLSSMSHDIRTPMNAVIGMTAIASMHLNEPEKVKDCLTKISASSKHLLGLINDVLDMSKIESGKIALNEENIILPELVHSFITIVQPQAEAAHLDMDIRVGNLEHELVIGDTLRINQLLLNIMSNAIKFTPSGGKISLWIKELPPQYSGHGTYQFVISDTGIGMSKEFLEKIYQPFERVQTSTNSKIEGTGLGMAITKSIVDMMNGQISVRSEPGKGTTFKVTLHLKLQEGADETYDFSALRELRALVVDDDRDVCEDTSRLLSEIGMESEWVLSGAEAVDKTVAAHENHKDYHSVIIDWKMPEMDGLETTRRIRSAVGDETPIIVLTAYDWTDIEKEAKEAGVNAFLSKPLFKSHLYHVMHNVVLGQTDPPPLQVELPSHAYVGRVLIVEDNAMNMEIAQEFVQRSGGTTDAAQDGREALRKIKNTPNGYYQLVLMDVQMPNMDGYESTRQIRQLEQQQGRKHTPIVAMSANAFVEDIDKAYAAGVDGYVTKPVGIEEISGVMSKYLTKADET